MAFDDCSREEQAQADALALGGEERFEYVACDLGVDARAGVGESYDLFVAVTLERDVSSPPSGIAWIALATTLMKQA